jgi:hypothetical protein
MSTGFIALGHPMAAAELATVMAGEAITPGLDEVAGSRFFELDVAGLEERTGNMLFDFHFDHGAGKDDCPVQVSASPIRSCVGVEGQDGRWGRGARGNGGPRGSQGWRSARRLEPDGRKGERRRQRGNGRM